MWEARGRSHSDRTHNVIYFFQINYNWLIYQFQSPKNPGIVFFGVDKDIVQGIHFMQVQIMNGSNESIIWNQ